MAKPRKTRAAATRKAGARKRPSGAYRSRLYVDLESIPRGICYRWVRETTLNEPDDARITDMMMIGWQPVPADRHPEMIPPALPGRDKEPPQIIRRGGLILMERPVSEVNIDVQELREENMELLQTIASGMSGGLNEDSRMPMTVDVDEVGIQKVATFKE